MSRAPQGASANGTFFAPLGGGFLSVLGSTLFFIFGMGMRVLLLSNDLSGMCLCRKLRQEGHEVRAHVREEAYRRPLNGSVPHLARISDGVDWVGRDGLIVCDDTGFGPQQDELRASGYQVVGGSAGGDALEDDRSLGQRVMADCGIKTVPTHRFASPQEAIAFLRDNPAEWVLKYDGRTEKSSSYVGELPDGQDVIDLLEAGGGWHAPTDRPVILQRRVRGIEIGVARYFNGSDWVGPIELNVEHKRLFPGDLGPNTPEMGTVMWYTADEPAHPVRLFERTLARLKPYLQQINFRGDVDTNCIIDEMDAYPLEVTARFGYPATQLQMALHESPWGEFLLAVSRGESYPLEYRREFGVVVLLCVPPFPCGGCQRDPAGWGNGLRLRLRPTFQTSYWQHLHLEGVEKRHNGDELPEYVIVDATGYVAHVTGTGNTISAANAATVPVISSLHIPRLHYRNDIGTRFEKDDLARLREWGWVN